MNISFIILLMFFYNVSFAGNFELNKDLYSITQQGLYAEISEDNFILNVEALLDSKVLNPFDLDYLGEAVVAIHSKNPHFQKSFDKYYCLSPELKFDRACQSKIASFESKLTQSETSQVTAEVKSSENSQGFWQHHTFLKVAGAALLTFCIYDFFQKNELILQYNF